MVISVLTSWVSKSLIMLQQTLHPTTFDLVGFSMGGIVSRYYVQRLRELTAFSASLRWFPNTAAHGWLYLSERPGCLQMRPDSPFIQKLNQDAVMLERLNFTSI